MQVDTVDSTRSLVCDLAEQMKQCKTNAQRDDLYYRASAAHPDIKPAYETAGEAFRKLRELSNPAKAAQEEIAQAIKVAESISGMPDDLTSMRNSRSNTQDQTAASLEQAKEKLKSMADAVRTAKSLHADASRNLEARRGTEYGDALWREMESIVGEIETADQNANGCVEGSEDKLNRNQPNIDQFNTRYTQLSDDLDLLRRLFTRNSQDNYSNAVESARAKAALIEMIDAKGEADLAQIAEDMVFAKACLNLIEEKAQLTYSAIMPDVTGMGCQDGMNAVANAGIQNTYKYVGQSAHPDWEYRVESTTPVAGTEVSVQETTATVNCFKDLDVAAFLATVDCSGVPRSTPQYNPATRQPYCDCVGGLVFNPSQTLCVDCNEYYRGYATEYNNGNMTSAQAWVNEAAACSWAQQAQGQIQQGIQYQACQTISTNLYNACANNNAPWASYHWQEANQWGCSIDPQLLQWATNVINAHNQLVQQQQQQQQQQIPGWGGATNQQGTMGNRGAGQPYGTQQGSAVPGTNTTPPPGTTPAPGTANTPGTNPPAQSTDPNCPSGVYVLGVCSGGG
jgi:hypothetical protein